MATIVNERYAHSLYEVAQDEDKVQEMLLQLTAVADAMRSTPEFLKMLGAPSIQLQDKKKILQEVFSGKVDQFLLNFLMLLTDKRRIGGLLEMQEAYKQRYYRDQGICEVCVTTAVPMDKKQTDKLKIKLAKLTGKKVILQARVDAAIMGGVVLDLGNEQIDTSIRTRLNELAQKMTQIIA